MIVTKIEYVASFFQSLASSETTAIKNTLAESSLRDSGCDLILNNA
jgi:hypothetical protein